MNIEIANRLLQLRRNNNLSQEELAGRIGISRQAVSKWERAEASPDTDNLISLAKLYNVSLDELLKTDEIEDIIVPNRNYIYIEDEKKELVKLNDTKVEEMHTFVINKKLLLMFPYPVFVTIIYLLLGVIFGLWHPAWIIYLTIPIYYCIVSNL